MIMIILALVYLIGMPIALRLLCHAQKKMRVDKAMEKAGRSKAALKNIPQPIWPKVKERIRFTFKDSRPLAIGKTQLGLENRFFFFIMYAAGLLLFVGAAATGLWLLLPVGIVAFFTAIVFSYFVPKKLLETREKSLRRMFNIANSKGLLPKEAEHPNEVIRVLEWNDFIKPQKIEFNIVETFNQMGGEDFLKQFNQVFGNETAWVPSDDPEKGTPGWNYEEGILTINAVPPLPQSAPWDAQYVVNDKVAWSFFPIALGVENGLELPVTVKDPETGEEKEELQNVLGFDLSGEQGKVSKEHGLKMSGTITTSPMVFIGGGTGGGKSLATKTKIKTLNNFKNIDKIRVSGDEE